MQRLTADFPRCFDSHSIIVFYREESFRKLAQGKSVTIDETVKEYDPDYHDEDFEQIQEGQCLVALEGDLWYLKRTNTHEYVRDSAAQYWLAEYRNGRITRVADEPLPHVLDAYRDYLSSSVPVVPMKA